MCKGCPIFAASAFDDATSYPQMPRLYSLVVKPSATTPFVPPPGGEGWHVTHAALAEGQSLNNYANLSFKTSDDVWISLGTLQSTGRDFMSLDLPLTEYTEFRATGTGDVHVTGTLAALEGDDEDVDVDFDFDEEEDEAEAEQEILNAMMNGKGIGREAKVHKMMDDDAEEGEETSSEEEPELQMVEEVEPPKLHGEKAKGKTTMAEASDVKAEDEAGLSKSARRRLKKKQRKEAKQATADVSDRQTKQQKTDTPTPEKPAAEKPSAEKTKAAEPAKADPRKKRFRRFSNGFVIENVSYGDEEGQMVKPGKKVTIKYKGSLENGKVFDQNQETGFTFRYGQGEVVRGLDKGLDDMRVGDKRKLTVPAKMGYGSQGAEPAVPPDADLTFEIELIKIE